MTEAVPDCTCTDCQEAECCDACVACLYDQFLDMGHPFPLAAAYFNVDRVRVPEPRSGEERI